MKSLSLFTSSNIRVAVVAATLLAVPNISAASTYTFVGSWILGEGPNWTTNPDVLTGQETAALLFGGSASDYAISTIDNTVANINFSTWLDGWGDSSTYATSGSPAAHDFKVDDGAPGYDDPSGFATAYSAYVQDHFNGTDATYTNYAFVVSQVPVPAAMPLLGFGLAGLFGLKRRKGSHRST